MADIQTAVQDIIRPLHLDSNTLGSNVVADVKRELIRAMRYYENEASWFLLDKILIPLKQGVTEYELDPYYQTIVGTPLYLPDVSQPEICWPVKLMSFSDLRQYTRTGDEMWAGTTVNEGQVRAIGISPAEGTLNVAPVPDSDISGLEMTIARSSTIPSYSYSGSTWTFKDPDGVTALSDTFENVWLKYAYDLIVTRAKAKLLYETYGGSDAAERKATQYERAEAMEFLRMRAKHNRKNISVEVPRNI